MRPCDYSIGLFSTTLLKLNLFLSLNHNRITIMECWRMMVLRSLILKKRGIGWVFISFTTISFYELLKYFAGIIAIRITGTMADVNWFRRQGMGGGGGIERKTIFTTSRRPLFIPACVLHEKINRTEIEIIAPCEMGES